MSNHDHTYQPDVPIPNHSGMLRPLFNQVLLRPLPRQENHGSLVVPATSSSTDGPISRGVVVATGEGHKWVPRAVHQPVRAVKHRNPLPVEPGDVVLYFANRGELHRFDGEALHVTPIEHVLGVVEP